MLFTAFLFFKLPLLNNEINHQTKKEEKKKKTTTKRHNETKSV
jgi:hypothetical protein